MPGERAVARELILGVGHVGWDDVGPEEARINKMLCSAAVADASD